MKKLTLAILILAGCGEKKEEYPQQIPQPPVGIEVERGAGIVRLIDRTNGVVCYSIPTFHVSPISCVKVAP